MLHGQAVAALPQVLVSGTVPLVALHSHEHGHVVYARVGPPRRQEQAKAGRVGVNFYLDDFTEPAYDQVGCRCMLPSQRVPVDRARHAVMQLRLSS